MVPSLIYRERQEPLFDHKVHLKNLEVMGLRTLFFRILADYNVSGGKIIIKLDTLPSGDRDSPKDKESRI